MLNHRSTDTFRGLFFSLSVVAILFNIGYFIADIYYTTNYISGLKSTPFFFAQNDFTIYTVIRYTLTVVICIVDIITTVISIRFVFVSWIDFLYHVIASFNILWLIHRAASTLIVFTANLTVIPAASIGTFTLALLAMLTSILVVFWFWRGFKKVLEYQAQARALVQTQVQAKAQPQAQPQPQPQPQAEAEAQLQAEAIARVQAQCTHHVIITCVKSLAFFNGVFLVILLMLWYLAILWDGARSSGTEDFILAVLPIIAITSIGWVLERKHKYVYNALRGN
jgi:hypothetical protein